MNVFVLGTGMCACATERQNKHWTTLLKYYNQFNKQVYEKKNHITHSLPQQGDWQMPFLCFQLVNISEYHVQQMQENAPSMYPESDDDSQSSEDRHFTAAVAMIYYSKVSVSLTTFTVNYFVFFCFPARTLHWKDFCVCDYQVSL